MKLTDIKQFTTHKEKKTTRNNLQRTDTMKSVLNSFTRVPNKTSRYKKCNSWNNKHSMDRFNSRLEPDEERINELEDRPEKL